MTWAPPTPTPEAGQGPWCDLTCDRWWVVAGRADQAVAEVHGCSAFPDFFGWRAIVEKVCIRWVDADQWDEEHEIAECAYTTDPGAVEAWRITVEMSSPPPNTIPLPSKGQLMNDDDLRHNYLERKRRDEAIQPVDTDGASARAGSRLSYLFGAGDYERQASEAEAFAFAQCICAEGKPMEDWQQRTPGVEHKRECPNHEPIYRRGQVGAALAACDVGLEKANAVMHVLRNMVKP